MTRLHSLAIKCTNAEEFLLEVVRFWNWYKSSETLYWTKRDLELYYQSIHTNNGR